MMTESYFAQVCTIDRSLSLDHVSITTYLSTYLTYLLNYLLTFLYYSKLSLLEFRRLLTTHLFC